MITNNINFGVTRVCSPKSTDISAVPVIPLILRNTMRGIKMKYIELTKGQRALVDDEDFEAISKHNWWADNTNKIYYAATNVKKKTKWVTVRMHRLVMNAQKGQVVDHVNHNGLDNRRANLRLCTMSQNTANQRRKNHKYKGVWWDKTKKKWRSHVMKDNKKYHIGDFNTDIEAAKAYDKKAQKLFGKFACLNFPEGSTEG